jgi:SAM-dependent methyltransferase
MTDRFYRVLDLGDLPLSGHLLRADQLGATEPRYPTEVVFCQECFLVQLRYTVPPVEVFATDYPYFSSTSDAWVAHCKRNVDALVARFGLGPLNLAVEIASNDGYLLQHFLPYGVQVLGVDPAVGPVRVARERGVQTVNDFFSEELAQRFVAEGLHADVVLGNNVLAHVVDQNDVVAGVATLLKDDGVAVFEFPHVYQLVRRCEFDTIYHEHLCYFSLTAACNLFKRHGLTIFDVEELPTHGGSLRIYACKSNRSYERRMVAVLQQEREQWVTVPYFYANFAERVKAVQLGLLAFLVEQSTAGKRVVAYGAAAKGGTLLNSCGIDRSLIAYVVDKSPFKQGRYMTGSRLPIYPPSKLLEDQPDYAVLLTWNFRDEILEQQAEYRRRGGKFVIPIPSLEVV